MTSWAARVGLLRSLVTYHAVPFKIHRLVALYRRFVRPGDLCFDLGAHVGDRTRAFLRLGARVVAVEPQPLLATFLERAFRGEPRVTVIREAVGRQARTATLILSERTPTLSSVSAAWADRVRSAPRFAGVRWDRHIQVPQVTLDQLVEQFGAPAFCKMDVEGSEADVLAGVSQPLAALSFEYIPALRDESRACLERLEALGRYEYNWSERESARLRSTRWLDRSEIDAVLDSLPPGGHSGDVYARLRDGAADRR